MGTHDRAIAILRILPTTKAFSTGVAPVTFPFACEEGGHIILCPHKGVGMSFALAFAFAFAFALIVAGMLPLHVGLLSPVHPFKVLQHKVIDC